MDDSDDIHAALALMYGYAARYAPSTVIEARIDALVVCYQIFLLLVVLFVVISLCTPVASVVSDWLPFFLHFPADFWFSIIFSKPLIIGNEASLLIFV